MIVTALVIFATFPVSFAIAKLSLAALFLMARK
jgi:hypothetical protein